MNRIVVPQGGGFGIPGGENVRRVMITPDMLQQMMAGQMVEPEPPEPTAWEKVELQSDAKALIEEVNKAAAPTIEHLKKIDASGEGDAIAAKGEAAVVRRELESNGIGFNSTRVDHQDAYLKFDPKSGEVQEFNARQTGKLGNTEMAIIREGDKTTYVMQEGMWEKTAVDNGDGTYDFKKDIHVNEEMKAMMALQMAMGGGGGGSPF